ncbi:hypothetical protein GCM10017600_49240 [Streptosporangium carneum]|uniref:Uncharacterized protein n=1 Tax=Streptosporangium carneum TaxID=47481 RepID=A0A9W6MEV5_9ACTN|nr:hypothetical protein GCM10017600_49240 [Streptosporangium carneum]
MTRATVFLLVAAGTVRRIKGNGLRGLFVSGSRRVRDRPVGDPPGPAGSCVSTWDPRGFVRIHLGSAGGSCEGERRSGGEQGSGKGTGAGLAHRYVPSATMSTNADEPPPVGSDALLTGRTEVVNPSLRPRAHRSGT